jgi:outer membrane protein OmpA-like peptidoglycan-associated protein
MKKCFQCLLIAALALSMIGVSSIPAGATAAGARATAYRIANTFERLGYYVRDAYKYGKLLRGTSHTTNTVLYQGLSYVFIAGGDEDAYDVDLRIYDENGVLVARDNDVNDVAVAKVTPRWTGAFYIKVFMSDSAPGGAHWVLVTGSTRADAAPPPRPTDVYTYEWAAPTTAPEIAAYFKPYWSIPRSEFVLDQYGRTRYSAAAVIHFATGSAKIQPESIPLLDEWGQALAGPLRRGVFMVEGHTDAQGSAAYNQRLSERRANAVRDYLISRWNIAPSRLIPRGFGQRFPAATNLTESGRASNRRVQFTLVDWVQ